ncbi:MAG: hypothetical protein WA862_06745 [Solirubrobacterales bacterium]
MRRFASAWAALALGLSIGAPAAGAAGAPIPGPLWTVGVDVGSAGLRGDVNPNGLVTTYHFSYLTENAYEANLAAGKDGFAGAANAPAGTEPTLGAASSPVQVAQSATGLAANTRYRLRLEAANTSGTVTSASIVFLSDAPADPTFMLDDRGWELISPTEKGGGEVQGPGAVFGGGVVQAAAPGSALTYSSSYSFTTAAPGAPPASQYISRRGTSGWETTNVTVPTTGGAYGPSPDGVPFQLFAPDLSAALMLEGLCAGATPCPRRYSLRVPGGAVLASTTAQGDMRLAGATPDLSQRILSTCAALTADAVAVPLGGGCDPSRPNLYRWSAAGLALINLLPAQVTGTPGASLAAPAGAVSTDGARTYFTHAGNLYLREGATTKQVDTAAGEGGSFEAASASGAHAYFSKAGHLYRYDAGGTATDLTPAGGLAGVLGASADGEWVYYLTSGGLFLRHGLDDAVKVADAADTLNYPPATGAARVTPDGRHLAFLATQRLTGFDNRQRDGGGPGVPGAPLRQVYVYDAIADRLTCASCNPYAEQPLGPATIPGAYPNGTAPSALRVYKPRALSEDGTRLFFESGDDLALRDVDRSPPKADPDVYEWEAQGAGSCTRVGGCVALVSSGRSAAGASFLDASASGNDVFFLTSESLVGADGGFADVYDARVGGGFPEASKPIACVGDACQFLPSEPEDPNPGTLTPSPGNPPLKVTAEPAIKCRKGFVKRKGKCVRKARKRGGKSKKQGGKSKRDGKSKRGEGGR